MTGGLTAYVNLVVQVYFITAECCGRSLYTYPMSNDGFNGRHGGRAGSVQPAGFGGILDPAPDDGR
jgi:hypothetical protein